MKDSMNTTVPQKTVRISIVLVLGLLSIAGVLSSCITITPVNTSSTSNKIAKQTLQVNEQIQIKTPTLDPGATATPDISKEPTRRVTVSSIDGSNINPLSGLPVSDPESLDLPPALVSISNFPLMARPQAGLSFSPLIFEFYTGQGLTCLLAYFYGDMPDTNGLDTEIGPVHSGRLPDEGLRQLYQGFLVNSGASENVARNLSHETHVFARTEDQIGNLMITSGELQDIALKEKEELDKMGPSGMLHDTQVPPNGKKADSFWLMYNYVNQIIWHYDSQSGAYLRYQDNGDATTFIRLDDRLTGEPLTFENVIIFFAEHKAVYETWIDVLFTYYEKEPALLLRDGQIYQIYWSTRNTKEAAAAGKPNPIRFIDYDGELFPLKPGQTWVEIVQPGTSYWESIDSDVYYDRANISMEGSGFWSMIFEAPGAILDTPD